MKKDFTEQCKEVLTVSCKKSLPEDVKNCLPWRVKTPYHVVVNLSYHAQTGRKKPVSKQLAANPKAEICAFQGGTWLRVAGELIDDDRYEAKAAMLDANPGLKAMYSADDDNTQVLYFRNATATFSSFTSAPETITF